MWGVLAKLAERIWTSLSWDRVAMAIFLLLGGVLVRHIYIHEDAAFPASWTGWWVPGVIGFSIVAGLLAALASHYFRVIESKGAEIERFQQFLVRRVKDLEAAERGFLAREREYLRAQADAAKRISQLEAALRRAGIDTGFGDAGDD